jgi:hypothetical protein
MRARRQVDDIGEDIDRIAVPGQFLAFGGEMQADQLGWQTRPAVMARNPFGQQQGQLTGAWDHRHGLGDPLGTDGQIGGINIDSDRARISGILRIGHRARDRNRLRKRVGARLNLGMSDGGKGRGK